MSNVIVALFEGLFSIVIYWAALAAIFTGLGLGIRRLFRNQPLNLDQCLTCFWIGFAATICFLQLWHLFFAVTWRSLAILALVSAASLCWNAKLLVDFLGTLRHHRIFLPSVACISLVSLWMANQAAGPPTEWNGVAYLTQTVRWITRYPAVLGLGNLYDCLAYNASSLLYAAMLESGPWGGRATHISNGLLVLMALLWALLSGVRAVRGAPGAKGPYIFDIVLLTPIIAIAVSVAVSSFTTDIPAALVTFIAGSLLYRFLTSAAERPSSYDAGVIVGLSSLAICLKASMIAIGPAFMFVVFVFLFRAGFPKPAIARLAKWSLAVSALLIVPWMIHGILLSGYPVFPSTFLGLNRDWRVPADYGVAVRWWIITAARHTGIGGLSWKWIPHWSKVEMRWLYTYRANQWGWGKLGVLAPSALTILAIPIEMIRAIREVRPRGHGWLLFVACAVGAMVWFWTAPASRFGFSFLWSLAAVAVAQTVSPYSRQVHWIALPIAAMAIAPILFPFPSGNVVKSLVERVIVPPGPDHGLYPFPKAELKRFVTESGLILFVPANDERCYDAPQPCTPDPTPNLILRMKPGGRPKFVIQGPWQPPTDWPNTPYHPEYVKFGPQRIQH